jgi:hypothetical protein
MDEMSESADSIDSPIPPLNLDEYSDSDNESTSSNLSDPDYEDPHDDQDAGILPAQPELISNLGSYWDPPNNNKNSVRSIQWIANLDSCWNNSKTKKALVNFIADLDDGFEHDGSVAKTDADRCVIENMRSHASKSTPQYGFSRGMKEFGDDGWKATLSELRDNLLGMDAVHMINSKEIDKALSIDALAYLMFLKRKRTGKIKARGCADGRPQREYIGKEESSSPTVSLYSLMLTACIDSIENRKVVTADIPGAFLQSD